jgi:hypothetical protein
LHFPHSSTTDVLKQPFLNTRKGIAGETTMDKLWSFPDVCVKQIKTYFTYGSNKHKTKSSTFILNINDIRDTTVQLTPRSEAHFSSKWVKN